MSYPIDEVGKFAERAELDVGSEVSIVRDTEEGCIYLRQNFLTDMARSGLPTKSIRAFLYLIAEMDNDGYARIVPKKMAKTLSIGRKHVLDPLQPLIEIGLLEHCGQIDEVEVYRMDFNFSFDLEN